MTGCHSCVASQGLLCLGVSGHGSSVQTCSSRPIPRPHLALYLAQPTRHQDLQRCAMGIAIVTTHMCKQRPLQFTWASQARSDLQGSCFQAFMFTFFAGVPCGRNARAHTDTKEGKAQANHGFCRGLSLLSWQRSKAGVHTVFTNPTSQMIWFLASVGLLLVGCCCCCFCCCCAVPFCCGFAGAGWLLLLVNYCWLAAAGLVLPAVWLLLVCCCCLAAAGGMLLVTFCCCWVVGVVLLLVGCLLLLAAAAASACAAKPTHLLLAVVAQTLSLWQCCKLGLESIVLACLVKRGVPCGD